MGARYKKIIGTKITMKAIFPCGKEKLIWKLFQILHPIDNDTWEAGGDEDAVAAAATAKAAARVAAVAAAIAKVKAKVAKAIAKAAAVAAAIARAIAKAAATMPGLIIAVVVAAKATAKVTARAAAAVELAREVVEEEDTETSLAMKRMATTPWIAALTMILTKAKERLFVRDEGRAVLSAS